MCPTLRDVFGPHARVALLVGTLAACGNPPAHHDGGVSADAPDAARQDAALVDTGPPPPTRVLFVGNSYTYFHDLPAVVEAILDRSTPGGAEVASVTRGGARLRDHWMETGAREAIEAAEHDVVVLQGQSIETVLDAMDFQTHAELLADAVAASGARGVWYANWARRDVEILPDVLWRAIEREYTTAASHHDDEVARVGAAWEIALLADPEAPLFESDRSHPAPAGTLLASCVIARAISGVDPVLPDETPLGLDRALAESLCGIACGGVPCGPEESLCDGACQPWDAEHCGGCDVVCGEEDPCTRGTCGCDLGRVGCDRMCVFLGNVQHCGACNDACALGERCEDASCTCPDADRIEIFGRFDTLTDLEPECANRDLAGTLPCNRAAHALCASSGCFDTGFLPAGHAPRPDAVMCLPGEERSATHAELLAFDAGCDGSPSQACATAIHRACVAAGAASGFGPIDEDATSLRFACVNDVTLLEVTASALQGSISRCEPDAATCSSAAWNLCEARGHTAGFGPVEADLDMRTIVCVDASPSP